MKSEPNVITPGIIAREIGAPLHRVLWILDHRPHIQPAARAGNLRVYTHQAIAMVRHELSAIDAKRMAKRGVSNDR